MSASSSSSRSATRRLIKELETWRSESRDERGIERLGPVGEDDLLTWEAVINGRGIGGGYDGTLLLLSSHLPFSSVTTLLPFPLHPTTGTIVPIPMYNPRPWIWGHI